VGGHIAARLKLTRRRIKRAVHCSVHELERDIRAFIEVSMCVSRGINNSTQQLALPVGRTLEKVPMGYPQQAEWDPLGRCQLSVA
jgi:hypothetical protein